MVDGSAEPRYPGTLANALPGYQQTLGIPVFIQFGPSKERPTLTLASDGASQLALDQSRGIDGSRYHEILNAMQT
jgi:hypothetical protein